MASCISRMKRWAYALHLPLTIDLRFRNKMQQMTTVCDCFSCICYSQWRHPTVEKPAMFLFPCNVINFLTIQALACFSSSCCSPGAQPATDTIPRGGGMSVPTAQSNTHSLRQYLWYGQTTTKNLFLPINKAAICQFKWMSVVLLLNQDALASQFIASISCLIIWY